MSGMNRLGKILFAAAVLLAAAAIAGVAQPHLGHTAIVPAGTAITVTGNGTVDVTPNRASFDFGVTSQAATAAEAMRRNASQARAIVDALKKDGVASSRVQTTEVSLWPQTSSDGRQITGYQASNSVHVTTPLGKAGNLVDVAVGAGANSVGGPSLDTADKSSLYAQALKQAVADAKTKAQAIADATGVALGAVVKVTEGSNGPRPIEFAAADTATAAPPIEAGKQQIQASVTVTYSAS